MSPSFHPHHHHPHHHPHHQKRWNFLLVVAALLAGYVVLVLMFFERSNQSTHTQKWPIFTSTDNRRTDSNRDIASSPILSPAIPVSAANLSAHRGLWEEAMNAPWQHWPAAGFCRNSSSLLDFLPDSVCHRALCLYSEPLQMFVDLDKLRSFSYRTTTEIEGEREEDWEAIRWTDDVSLCRRLRGGQRPLSNIENDVETSFVVSLETNSDGVRYDGVDALLEILRIASETRSAEYTVEVEMDVLAVPRSLSRLVNNLNIAFQLSVSLSPSLSRGKRSSSFDAKLAQKCRGLFVATVRADVLVLPGWLSLSLRTLKENFEMTNDHTQVDDREKSKGGLRSLFQEKKRVGAVGPMFLSTAGRVLAAEGVLTREGETHVFGEGRSSPRDFALLHARAADFLSPSCVIMRKEALASVWPFQWSGSSSETERSNESGSDNEREKQRQLAVALRRANDMARRGFRSVFQPLSVVVQLDETPFISRTVRNAVTQQSPSIPGHCPSPFSSLSAEAKSLSLNEQQQEQLLFEREEASVFFRDAQRVLVLEDVVPETDRDAGSIRLFALLQILSELGLAVSFEQQPITNRSIRYVLPLLAQGINMLIPGTLHDMAMASQHALGDAVRAHGGLCPWKLLFIARRDVFQRHWEDVQRLCPGVPIIFDTVDVHFIRELRMFANKHAEKEEALPHLEEKKAEPLDVLALLESDFSVQEEMLAILDAQKRELEYMRRSDITLVVSTAEQVILQKVFRNSVDVRIVSNIYSVDDNEETVPHALREGAIFAGNMCHTPNVDAVEFIVKEVLKDPSRLPPSFRMHLVWSRSHMCPHSIHAEALAHPLVTVHRDVSNEGLLELHRQVKVVLAPLRYGAGVKGKVNYGLLHGVPVIATRVASEGMGLKSEENFLLAETGEEFVRAIQRVYQDEVLFHRLVRGGKQVMKDVFGRDVAKDKIRQALIDVNALPDARKREEERECPFVAIYDRHDIGNWENYWHNSPSPAEHPHFFPLYPRIPYDNPVYLNA